MTMLNNIFEYFLKLIERGKIPSFLYKSIWKFSYQLISRKWKTDEWTFMNYGWLPENSADEPDLTSEDEKNRYFIGLYNRLASRLDIKGKRVLEVGSGRGGGASWISRHFAPESMVALDFSREAIKRSREWHKAVPNLEFKEGDAENLPFPDNSFDVIINVESSHCYGNMEKFVSEVVRVLRPGGVFGWVDMRSAKMMDGTNRAFDNPSLVLTEEDTLNEGVIRALNGAEEIKREIMKDIRFGSAIFHQFSGAKGSELYKAIARNDVVYLLKVFRKQDLAIESAQDASLPADHLAS